MNRQKIEVPMTNELFEDNSQKYSIFNQPQMMIKSFFTLIQAMLDGQYKIAASITNLINKVK